MLPELKRAAQRTTATAAHVLFTLTTGLQNMRNIAPPPHLFHNLPLFAWAARQRLPIGVPTFTRYRVNHRLEVVPLWEGPRHV